MLKFRMLIDGKLTEGNGELLKVISPIDAKEIVSIKTADEQQTQTALEAAQNAFKSWSRLSLVEREKHIRNLIDSLYERKAEIKEMLRRETGKPEVTLDYDFEMIPNCLKFFIEEAKRLNDEIIPDLKGDHINFTIRKPIGVVGCHLAWNFPLLNVAYKIGPILASGCTCVLKPSSKTPLATLLVAEAIQKSSLPAGVINIVVGRGSVVSKVINESKIPAMLTAIGSTRTGKNIIKQSATSIKQFSLELGGNAPVVVMSDADAYKAGQIVAELKFGNCGQVCVSPNRVFVHKDVMNEFIKGACDFTSKITLGSGNDEGEVLMGPLISEGALKEMESLVKDAKERGGKIICGGKKADREGFFFEPTIINNCNKDMKLYKKEIFGPIMPIYEFTDADDPVMLANDTEFGLAAYLFTTSLENAQKISRGIDAGSVIINDSYYEYNLPHGGLKQSGIGKDCSTLSLKEYYSIQRISLKI